MTIHPDRIADYLQHIIEAIDRAMAYARKAQTFEVFEADVLLQDGIVRNIGVIGEAAIKIGQIEPNLAARWPGIPWREIQTMRHKLVHDYFDVDLLIVWETVQNDLPKLAIQTRQILAELDAAQPDSKPRC